MNVANNDAVEVFSGNTMGADYGKMKSEIIVPVAAISQENN